MRPWSANPSRAEAAFLMSAPPPRLPLGFFVPGVLALGGAFAALPFFAPRMADWFGQQEILALVHTVTVGFALTVFLGASVQLLPVLAGDTLPFPPLVRMANVLVVIGGAGMIGHFWKLRWGSIVVYASSVALGVVIFLALTLRLLIRGRSDAVRLGLALAYVGLLLTIGAGILLALDRKSPFLGGAPLRHVAAHIHLGILATFGVAIFAVESKLLPMFLLAPAPEPRLQKAAITLLFGGTVLLACALWFGLPPIPFAILPALAVPFQAGLLVRSVRARRRSQIDTGFVYALSAYSDLAAATVVGFLWAAGWGEGSTLMVRLPWVYVFLLLVGFVVQTIVGILSKILTFLVWQAVYARRVGLARVPTLAELSSERLQRVGFWAFRIATILTAVALFRGRIEELRIASALLALSLVPFVLHVARVLLHLKHLGDPISPGPSLGRAHVAADA
jgi:hypothetical protein